MIRLVWTVLLILLIVVWIRTLVEIIRTPDHAYRAGNQILWAMIVVLVPLVGIVLYYAMGAPERRWRL